jgi:NDP-sugar pyrophosphorylase family protein
MKDLTMVILAAGMGSRYGGLKQIDKFGVNGEAIIDFSIYDAIAAGFNKIVLIIRKEHEEIFEEVLVAPIRKHVQVDYAFQDINDVPEWFEVPKGRVKPWGTTHALLSAKPLVDSPFVILNADDYYGKESFVEMAKFLQTVEGNNGAMMGYVLNNTLTDHGTVTRGICEGNQGYLVKAVETHGIKRTPEGVVSDDGKVLPDDSLVSMNFWGFTPAVFDLMQEKFEVFLKEEALLNVEKSEALLPNDVAALIADNKLKVKILQTPDQWFGVTYQEDKPRVLAQFEAFQKSGVYPEKLWD